MQQSRRKEHSTLCNYATNHSGLYSLTITRVHGVPLIAVGRALERINRFHTRHSPTSFYTLYIIIIAIVEFNIAVNNSVDYLK